MELSLRLSRAGLMARLACAMVVVLVAVTDLCDTV